MSALEDIESKLEKEIKETNKILNEVVIMVRNHETYVSDGKKWRLTVIGVATTMFVQVCGGLYLVGQLNERIDNNIKLALRNELRLDRNDEEIKGFLREGRAYFRDNTNK
jgi:hypothetical protein